MPVAWFLCPFDLATVQGRQVRRCAMTRHLPRERADGAGPRWEEAELLGGGCLVKVEAPLAVLTLIDADPDFRRVPHATETIPLAQRPALRQWLTARGYADADLDGSLWAWRALLRRLLGQAGVPQSKPLDRLESRLPGE